MKTIVPIRIGTFNIQHGSYVKLDYTIIANDVKELDLDIVGFQEIDQLTTRNKMQDTMKILSESSGYPYYKFCKAIDHRGGEYGTAVLSKHPIKEFHVQPLPSGDHEQRSVGYGIIDVHGHDIFFVNTHLGECQQEQFSVLAELLEGKAPYILTADFNNRGFAQFDRLPAGRRMINNAQCPVPTTINQSTIDNIIFSPDFRLNGFRVESQVEHSDHYLVWAELKLHIEESD